MRTFIKGTIQATWVLSHFSCVQIFATPWTVACQAPLSMGFSRKEHWSGLPCPPPGNLPDSGIELASLTSPALAGRFFTTSATSEAQPYRMFYRILQIIKHFCRYLFDVHSILVKQELISVCYKWEKGTQLSGDLLKFLWLQVTRSDYKSCAHMRGCVSVCAQLCPTLCDPKDDSLPGSSVHENSQARILQWVAISFFRGSS